jgi:hypothetical protein
MTQGVVMSKFTKTAAEEAVQRDDHAAFELGFQKAAAELGVTKEQYQDFYKSGLELQASKQTAAAGK